MYKIIIVDDETNAIEGLKILIDTKRNNISEILSSNNAIEALKIIDSERPDIIISDISMPQMTGLEMIAEIKKIENYSPMIVILSGYSTFSYAQQAMSHGVKAYLLKPVDEDELNDKLDELIGEIEANSQQTFEKNIILEASLYKILSGDKTTKNINNFLSRLGFVDGNSLVVLGSNILYNQNKDIELSDEELDKDFENLKELFQKYFGKTYNCNSFRYGGNKMVSFVWGNSLNQNEINDCYKAFLFETENTLSVSVPVNYSNAINNGKGFIVELTKIMENKNLETADKPSNVSSTVFKEVNDLFLSISNNFEVLYREELEKDLKIAIDKAIENNISIKGFENIFNAFIVNISSYVAVENNSVPVIMAKVNDIHKKGNSLSSLKDEYVSLLLSLFDDMNEYNNKLQNETFHSIITYVDNNFTENLTLKSLSSRFYVNPIYLGRVFKKQTGTLFNEYLTTLRIEKSKVLLKKTSKKVYEIAEEIGFNDPNYFIAKFLKSEGVTPSSYRKQNKE